MEITVRTQEEEEDGKTEQEEEGMAEKRGRLCLPKTMQHWILHEADDSPAGGHFGADRTYICIKDRHFWKPMWCETQHFVAVCDLRHRTNHHSGKPMGLLQPLPTAKGHWQRFGIDFLTDLPVSGSGHNCIETFVNPLTKRAHWWARRKTIDASTFAHLVINHIIRPHGVPHELVLDHVVHFTADYWRDVARIVQTKLVMSTVFHSETDGLSENLNKTVICDLGGFATHNQANWDDYLPFAECAYNSSELRSTKQTPFTLNLGYEPPLPLDLIADLQRLQANESAKHYRATSSSNNCSTFRELPGKSCEMLRINRRRWLISPDVQLTLPSLPVRRYFDPDRICQSHTSTSILRDRNWYIVTLAIRNSSTTLERCRTRSPKRHDNP